MLATLTRPANLKPDQLAPEAVERLIMRLPKNKNKNKSPLS
jgi:hypothetical protein